MKPFNLERALAGDEVAVLQRGEYFVAQEVLKSKIGVIVVYKNGQVLLVNNDGIDNSGFKVLFMAAKIQFNWFVRSNKVNTQGASGIPGYWQSNVLVGEEGRKYLVDHYAHRLGHELTLHSQEIEE